MLIYENGNNDYGKQIRDYKEFKEDIKYEIETSRDLEELLIILHNIHSGMYDSVHVPIYGDEYDGLVEYTGTSPCLVELDIWKFYNREIVLRSCYYQQRFYIYGNFIDMKSKDLSEGDFTESLTRLYLVKTYFCKISLPFAISHEYQEEILRGNFYEAI